MNFQPACPPLPTLDELFSNPSFYEVNINELVPNETVVFYNPSNPNMPLVCIQIISNTNTHLRFRPNDQPDTYATSLKSAIQQWRFFRKDERRNYEEFMNENIRVDMKEDELNKPDAIKRNVFQSMDQKIGDYLNNYPSRAGRKYKGTNKMNTLKRKRTTNNNKKTKNKRKNKRRNKTKNKKN
jgi:hypothetical protein